MTANLDSICYLHHADIEAATKLTPKKIQDWLDRGILAGHIGQPGKGGRRLYSIADTVMLAVASDLVQNYGVAVKAAVSSGGAVRAWLLSHPGQTEAPFFAVENGSVMTAGTLAELASLVRSEAFIVVNASAVIRRVRASLRLPISE